jgi:biopolymer transport protein ExbD
MARVVKRFDEINITPLTDIFLVLLIIMMVVAPAMSQQKETLVLPSLQYGQTVNATSLTVEINQLGQPSIQGEAVNFDQLAERIKALLPTVADAKVVIRADKATENTYVINAMNAVATAGVERVVFAGEAVKRPIESEPDVETSMAEVLTPTDGEGN